MSDLGLNYLRGLSDRMLCVISVNKALRTLSGFVSVDGPEWALRAVMYLKNVGVRQTVWTLSGHCPLPLLL